ncbi:glycosyltransferase [Mucilaginibacter sp. UR6-11]|uniref:glycosyltransferase n=1 Tax=Mucilaginibacter sp. UR6-11 TaxID=1435644 RepID=UPI001E418521|nr:glycosyltransferase [Mucilaginibacter sp. UR6-11]MCC8426366.1 glycosyltransferase [Mucilaginibacter sp. UR6-11]
MAPSANRMVFISMSDVANGAEKVLLMAAKASMAPIIFLKKSDKNGLHIPKEIVHIYASDRSMIKGFLKLIILLFRYRKEYIVMSTHPYLNAYLGILKRIGYLRSYLVVRECSSVFTRYSGFKKFSYKLVYGIGYSAVNLVVCQTELMKQQFLKHIRFIQPDKVIVLNNPIDRETIIKKAEKCLDDGYYNTQFICAAGRLIPEKGFDVLIRAFNCIKKQYPNLKLLLFGDGPQKAFLSKMITDHGLTNRVILKGWTENPIPYFKNASVCVVSSIEEGFPNVLLEMLSVNPRVVSTLCAGGIENIPEIFTAKANDVDQLAIAIKKALCLQQQVSKAKHNDYLLNRIPAVFVDVITKAL